MSFFLEPGEPIELTNGPVDRTVYEAICQWLARVHKLRILHCDVRTPNMIRFKSGVQLTDFGLATVLPPNSQAATVSLRPGNDRYQKSGFFVKEKYKQKANVDLYGTRKVKWTALDDIQMLDSIFMRKHLGHI